MYILCPDHFSHIQSKKDYLHKTHNPKNTVLWPENVKFRSIQKTKYPHSKAL